MCLGKHITCLSSRGGILPQGESYLESLPYLILNDIQMSLWTLELMLECLRALGLSE